MLKMLDIMRDREPNQVSTCPLTVSEHTPVGEAFARMWAQGCDFVGVKTEQGDAAVLSMADVFVGVISELEQAQLTLASLKTSFEKGFLDQLDSAIKETHKLSREENDKLRLAVNNMSEGMIIFDVEGQVESANPSACEFMGLEKKADIGEVAKAIKLYGLEHIIDSGTGKTNGLFKMKLGEESIFDIAWHQITSVDNQVLGDVLIFRDITGDIASEKAKNEFVSAISHELRTPVTSIQNSISNIMAGVTGKISTKTRQYLETCKGDCHRLADLINDLVDMAKLDSGLMPINRGVASITRLVRKVEQNYYEHAGKKQIRLDNKLCGYRQPVLADGKRIYQVISHLVENALKYTPDGGKIILDCSEDEENFTFSVTDTGTGISENIQEHIFKKFFQENRQAGAGYKGSGLGLAICRGIINMHGGNIWVESRKDIGSTFKFTLPKVEPAVALRRQLSILTEKSEVSKQGFALMIINCATEHEDPANNDYIRTLIKEIIQNSDNFILSDDDIIVKTYDYELSLLINEAQAGHIKKVSENIHKILKNTVSKTCNKRLIMPMFGIALCPEDSRNPRELEEKARLGLKRIS